MSDTITMLLDEYTTSDADRRSTIIETLADSTDERVHCLFFTILTDKSEEDFVRVEVLKSVPFQDYTNEARRRFCNAICMILNDKNDDELVRQFAALAMRRFIDVDGVLELLEHIVTSEDEDLSIRYNALDAIERNATSPLCQSSLKRLVSVPVLGRSAARTLQRLPNST